MNSLEKNNIPVGYKDSAVGVIPQEWEVKLLEDLCENICSGNNKERNKYGKYRIYGSTGIIGYSNTYSYNTPTILIARVGANAGIINKGEGEYDVSDNTLIVCNNKFIYDYEFAYNQLANYNLNKLVFGSGQPLVTAGQLKHIKLAIPPLAEQRKIAEILGVWDEAIEKQSRLIEKLELRKRAMMQRLLTGRTLLSGFNTPWQKVKLGEICEEYILRNTEDNDYIVLSCTKYNGLVSSLDYFGKQIFSDNLRTYKVVPKYHFAYATNHIEEGSIGYQGSYDYALISPMYTVFKADDTKVDNYFLYTLLKTPLMIYNYQSRIEGSIDRRGGLRWDAFAGIIIKLPSLTEQKAIAEVLTTTDNEIATHCKKLDALRLQKRGLMQQLLTGKTRVKI